MKDIISTHEAEKGFYPTPSSLCDKLLAGIDWSLVEAVLEPSAGKGNIVEAISEKIWHRIERKTIDVDCIEIDPYLRSILQYNFSNEHLSELRSKKSQIKDRRKYNREEHRYEPLSDEDNAELADIEQQLRYFDSVNMYIVHDDFLTFESRKRYSLCVMNPPFSDGDKHLLKAISLIQPYGGEIRCILNAETIRNPYTNSRKILTDKLSELNADISYESDAFYHSERPTHVEVAIIKISIPMPKYENDPTSLYNRMKAAAFVADDPDKEVQDLTFADFIQRIVSQFNFEVDAGIRLIHEYLAMKPYILNSLNCDKMYNDPILSLTVECGSSYRKSLSVNAFLSKVRLKYWRALLENHDFMDNLTSDLRSKYLDMVGTLVNYDFSSFNIQKLVTEMNAEMMDGVKNCIVKLFDEMTVAHSWFPECEKNIYLFNGWKTNKAHKVNFPKVIIPCYNIFNSYSWNKDSFDLHKAHDFLSDIEKVFNYLDGNMTAPCELFQVLKEAQILGQTKNIKCKFFSVTFYKKGTVHIKFHSQDLIDRFNIYCCQQKGWLPPVYGKANYRDMDNESKAVIDEFHGNGDPGSGELEYSQIMTRSDYFLAPPNQSSIGSPALTA